MRAGETALIASSAGCLNLTANRDFSSVARLHYDTEVQVSGEAEPTAYTVEFYVVEPYGSRVEKIVNDDPDCRWASTAELVSGTLADGSLFDQIQATPINRSGILLGC